MIGRKTNLSCHQRLAQTKQESFCLLGLFFHPTKVVKKAAYSAKTWQFSSAIHIHQVPHLTDHFLEVRNLNYGVLSIRLMLGFEAHAVGLVIRLRLGFVDRPQSASSSLPMFLEGSAHVVVGLSVIRLEG